MKYKSIFSPKIARYLLKTGNSLYDIKPDKNDENKCKKNWNQYLIRVSDDRMFKRINW